MNKQKLTASLKKAFGCSVAEADEWASDIIRSESMANGRLGSFQEIIESTAGGEVEDFGLSEQIRARARHRAGLRTFKEPVNDDDGMKLRIQHRGGIRI